VLDTTVLVARPVHQFIGTLGTEGAFDVAWSDELVSELIEVLTRPKAQQGFAWDPRAAEAVAGYVRTNFPMGEVASVVMATRLAAAEQLVRDPGDAHVVALALAASADCIVTANKKDFRVPELDRLGIAVVTPDRFLMDLYRDIPEEVVAAVPRQITSSTPYPATSHDILSLLYRAGCRQFAKAMCGALGLPAPNAQRHFSPKQ